MSVSREIRYLHTLRDRSQRRLQSAEAMNPANYKPIFAEYSVLDTSHNALGHSETLDEQPRRIDCLSNTQNRNEKRHRYMRCL